MNAPLAVPPWKPRASAIGSYVKCLWRAANDRAIHEGRMPAEAKVERGGTAYADFGTCIHFILQDGMRCTFPGDPREFAPKAEEWTSAASLFGSDMALTQERARASAMLASRNLPRAPDGRPWRSEDEWENEFLTGHTDFLSENEEIIGDLKSTSRPPPHKRIKYEHYVQVCGYKLLRPKAKRAFVLYVDSMKAQWTTLVWINFEDPNVQFFVERVADFCRFLMSDKLWDAAYPNLGDHCHDTWCGYKHACADVFLPAAGTEFNAIMASKPTGVGTPMQWGGRAV